MVRILKVRRLEEEREALLRGSEMCRQILHAEIGSISSSAQRFKRRVLPFRNTWGFVAAVAPILISLLVRRSKKGFLSRLFSGFAFASSVVAAIKKVRAEGKAAPEPDEVSDWSRS